MKIVNSVIGIFFIFLGWSLMSVTVFNEQLKTITCKVIGFLIVVGGIIYLKKVAKLGKQ